MLTEKHAKLRSEIQLLILLGRKNADDSAIDSARELINSNIDWDYLLAAAVFHGVFPPFFKRIKTYFADTVPAKCFRMMTGHNEKIRYLNLALVGTFLQFHSLLEKNNIKSVIFKGPALAESLYDDLLMREYSDVDVLVSRADAPAAQALLLDSGYRPAPERKPPLSREFIQSDVFFKLECEHTFEKKVPIGVIDLHWQIQPRHVLPLDFEKVMNHTTPMILEQRTVQTLEPNLLVVVLAAHASRHMWKRLLWMCDIAEMLENPAKFNIDWLVVKESADQLSVTPMVVIGLNLTHRLFGCPIPDFAKFEMTTDLQRLSNQLFDNLAVLSQEDAGMRMLEWKCCAELLSTWPAKLRYIATEMFHPSVADYVRLNLPASLYRFYYLLHPAWLLQDAIARRLRPPVQSTSKLV